eukprot:354599-Chlamydomonas_euryale.AAC.5
MLEVRQHHVGLRRAGVSRLARLHIERVVAEQLQQHALRLAHAARLQGRTRECGAFGCVKQDKGCRPAAAAACGSAWCARPDCLKGVKGDVSNTFCAPSAHLPHTYTLSPSPHRVANLMVDPTTTLPQLPYELPKLMVEQHTTMRTSKHAHSHLSAQARKLEPVVDVVMHWHDQLAHREE